MVSPVHRAIVITAHTIIVQQVLLQCVDVGVLRASLPIITLTFACASKECAKTWHAARHTPPVTDWKGLSLAVQLDSKLSHDTLFGNQVHRPHRKAALLETDTIHLLTPFSCPREEIEHYSPHLVRIRRHCERHHAVTDDI